jgi:hypothetical protein
MQTKNKKLLLVLILLEGVAALFRMMWVPSEPETARLFGYSYSRLGFAGIFVMALALLLVLIIKAFRSEKLVEGFVQRINDILVKRNFLYPAHDTLLGLLVLTAGAYSFTYLLFSPHFRSLIVWVGLIFFQIWVLLRKSYAANFRERVSWLDTLRTGWRSWTPTQQRVFWTLIVIGLIYFAAFIPINLQNADDPHTFFLHGGDEYVTYPVVVTMLTPGDTFHTSMYRLFIYEDYHYGYPFYALSALVLLVPRLVFGGSFAGHTRINLLLLRQMASVLPMILSIFVLVYIVTRFKSWARAVSIFVVLLLIPGVVKYNERFWHPDSLLLLFIVLTFYFLQRDRLRFGRNFYLAAVTCGLATATKLYGFLFFLAVGGYLLAGLVYRVLGFRKMILAGLLFVLTMSVTVLLANPFLIDSEARARMVEIMQDKNAEMAHGYNEPDPQHIYRTGLEVWIPFRATLHARLLFLLLVSRAGSRFSLGLGDTSKPSVVSLVCGGGWLPDLLCGGQILSIYIAADGPLYAGVFLFPAVADGNGGSRVQSFLARPLSRKLLWAITIVLCGSQFVFNLVTIFTYPVMGF